ncbi:MAG: endonuclease V [Pseudomonadota bacterium]
MPTIALDAAYAEDGRAAAAAVSADSPAAPPPYAATLATLPLAAPYAPGAFYQRELPVLLAALERAPPADLLIVDGYAVLDSAGRPGLGARLSAALGGGVPVIGVAKSRFAGDDASIPALRGRSLRPLHVTVSGLDPEQAAEIVRRMAGDARMPLLLREADRAARAALEG